MECREVKNCCVVCMKLATLTVRWKGPGHEKPAKPNRAREEFKGMDYKPVKVMNAYVCGLCRVTSDIIMTLIRHVWPSTYPHFLQAASCSAHSHHVYDLCCLLPLQRDCSQLRGVSPSNAEIVLAGLFGSEALLKKFLDRDLQYRSLQACLRFAQY